MNDSFEGISVDGEGLREIVETLKNNTSIVDVEFKGKNHSLDTCIRVLVCVPVFVSLILID